MISKKEITHWSILNSAAYFDNKITCSKSLAPLGATISSMTEGRRINTFVTPQKLGFIIISRANDKEYASGKRAKNSSKLKPSILE